MELAEPEVSFAVGDDPVGRRLVCIPADQQPLRFQCATRRDARLVDASPPAGMTARLDRIEQAAVRAERRPVSDEIAVVNGMAVQSTVVAVVRSERLFGCAAQRAGPDPSVRVVGRIVEADVLPVAVHPVDPRRRHGPMVVEGHVMEP